MSQSKGRGQGGRCPSIKIGCGGQRPPSGGQ